jgi:hypothetical protein
MKGRILIFVFLIVSSWKITLLPAEIILEPQSDTTHPKSQKIPTIVYSTTLLTPVPKASNPIVQSFVLSIFPDGSANVMQTVDNQQNLSLPPNSRKLILQTFGPKILPEQVQSSLQQYFAKTIPWNIPKKAFVIRDPKEKGFWMAELSLQTETLRHHCAFSSSEKNPEITQNAYEFLTFLEKIRHFVCERSEKLHQAL